jgi:biotin carboxyl carrier protein
VSGERRFWVTPASGAPYRVDLRAVSAGWEAVVEREGERWTFPLSPGERDDEAWVGERLVRFRWDPAAGRLALEGWSHELAVQSEAAHRVAELGLRGDAGGGPARVLAPMPGLVLLVEVSEGERVSQGQGVLIIEAMKMENEIRAPVAGVVRRLSVSAGDAVERDALLCIVEPEDA